MKTAKEFLETDKDWNKTTAELMIEFAKMHVRKALKQASEDAETTFDSANNVVCDRDSILQSYCLDDIV